jgi:hypothetical protein
MGALLAAFGTAARRGRIATTDIRALDQPGAEDRRAEAYPAEVAAGAGPAVVAATVAVGTDRSKGNHER